MWHGYLGIENLALNAAQKAELVTALRALGPPSEGDEAETQPARVNHWRTRLDDDAAIFEALFKESALTVQAWKDRLGTIFDVDPATIDHVLSSVTFDTQPSTIAVFSRGGTDYLRVALFGGAGAAWEESRIECLGYLKANQAEWEPVA
jgi:hypothetical protein